MKKLTRYTSIRDLKADNSQQQPQKSDSKYESDLMGFIAIMKQHSSSPKQSKKNNSSNKSGNGK